MTQKKKEKHRWGENSRHWDLWFTLAEWQSNHLGNKWSLHFSGRHDAGMRSIRRGGLLWTWSLVGGWPWGCLVSFFQVSKSVERQMIFSKFQPGWDLMFLLREDRRVLYPIPKFCFSPLGKSCGTPAEPLNGKMIVNGDTRFGSTVHYACNEGWVGHSIIGDDSSRTVAPISKQES